MSVDIQQLLSVCEPAAAAIGYDLVDLEFQREPQGWVLRIYIDRLAPSASERAAADRGLADPVGVDLDDCARVSRELSAVLDGADPIEVPYHLEVSSPGLARPLRREQDFQRYSGRLAKVRLRDPMDTVGGPRKNFAGIVLGAEDGRVAVDCDGVCFEFPLAFVHKAHLDLDDALGAGGVAGEEKAKAKGRKPPRAHARSGEPREVKRASER